MRVFHFLKFEKISFLFLKKLTHTFLEKSSIKVNRYLTPPFDETGTGPYKLE